MTNLKISRDTLLIVNRNTRGNLNNADDYTETVREFIDRNDFDTCRGTMTVSYGLANPADVANELGIDVRRIFGVRMKLPGSHAWFPHIQIREIWEDQE